MGVYGIASLADLKRSKHVQKHINWNIEPKQLMEPRCRITEDSKQEIKTINGYLFYIDKMTAKKPTLFLMYHTAMGYAETVAKIDEIPDELMLKLSKKTKPKNTSGCIPLIKRLKAGLKRS